MDQEQPERQALRQLLVNQGAVPLAQYNASTGTVASMNQENATPKSQAVDVPSKQMPPADAAAASAERPRPRRSSLTNPEDMAKLNSSYNDLSQTFLQFRKSESSKPGWNTSTRTLRPGPKAPKGLGTAAKPPVPSQTRMPSAEPHLQSTNSDAPIFTFSTHGNNSESMAKAVEMFQHPEFLAQCTDILNAQLTRTKEGATTNSKIQELAGMTKALRRCLRQMAGKVSDYADYCSHLEKEASQKLEHLEGSRQVLQREFEEELAQARQQVNVVSADHAKQRVQLVADSEHFKYELTRVQAELKVCQQEREKASVAFRACEQAKALMDIELKDCRRQLSTSQGSGKRLQDENTMMKAQLDAFKLQLSTLQKDHKEANADVRTRQQQQTALETQLEMFKRELIEEKERSGVMSSRNSQLEGDNTSLRMQSQRSATEAEALRRQTDSLREQLKELIQQHDAQAEAWSQEQELLQTAKAALSGQVQELQREVQKLGAALQEAEGLGQELRQSLEGAQENLQALQEQHCQLKEKELAVSLQLEETKGVLKATEQELEQVVAAKASLQESSEADKAALLSDLEAIREVLSNKSARLAHLEGEFEALQEVIGEGDHKDVVARLLSKISSLQQAAAQAEELRRKLHNQIIEMRGNIRVYCRVRPYPEPDSSVRCLQDGASLAVNVDGKDHTFKFDQVFAPSANQESVFAAVSELVQSALDGYHVCLFSYGQTGAGKTFTMQGSNDPTGRGIIPRAVEKVLQAATHLEAQDWQYTFEASFIEIYNNTLRDLLAPASAKDHGRISDQNAIKHDANGGHTTVVGASRWAVPDLAVATDLVQRASSARAVESTAMNATSSRSHSVFMLYITGRHPTTNSVLQGSLCLVDLAGSERLDRSGAEAERKKEACSINQSLSSLGDVFASLSTKSAHIPYRNSKLTYLLQPCLGGSGKTLMFVNINPEPLSASESLQSLKFAAKVNGCETAAKGGAKRNLTTTTDPSSTRPPVSTPSGVRRSGVGLGAVETPRSTMSRQSLAPGRRLSIIPSATKPATGIKRPSATPSSQAAKRPRP